MTENIIWGILYAIGGYIFAILTPTLSRGVENLIFGIPNFELEEYELDRSRYITVKSRRRWFRSSELGMAVLGNRYGKVAKPVVIDGEWVWKVDLTESRFSQLFNNSTKNIEISFFLGDGTASSPIRVSLSAAIHKDSPPAEKDSTTAIDNSSLISAFRSDNICTIDVEEVILSHLRAEGDNVSWIEVFNGWEIAIDRIKNFSATSSNNSKIVSPISYAYVLTFNEGKKISLSGLQIGHIPMGDCTGGVTRFYRCEGVLIDSCGLFGCGTVGIDLIQSKEVEIVDSKIFECSYAAATIENSGRIHFARTTFSSNNLYNLFVTRNQSERIIFEECIFSNNEAQDFFFYSNVFPTEGALAKFVRCHFEANSFKEFSNIPDSFFEFVECSFDKRDEYN